MPHFTEDNVQRIIINPFYAITVASQWTEEHEPPMSEAEWVPINPSQAVNIDPLFAVEHPPLIGREMWVDVNVMHIRNMGTEGWLRQLLDVLNGDIVTAEEVGFAPPGGTFGYRAPARSHARRRGKQRRKRRNR